MTIAVRILVGSLNGGSINRALAEALVARRHPRFTFAFSEIGDLPFHRDELEAAPPAAVLRLRGEIAAVPAVLFVMPEHNRSIPAVLKNAIDWVSRPHARNGWAGKVGAVTGTSPGPIGTAVGQQHLRLIVSPLGVAMLPRPEMYVTWQAGLRDDPAFAARLDAFLNAFAIWTDKLAT